MSAIVESSSLLDAALELRRAGLSVMPARRAKKHPLKRTWKQFRSRPATEDELRELFTPQDDAVCLVTGRVSGNLEAIDFDHGGDQFSEWSTLIPPDVLDRLVIETSQSGGRHVLYRCDAPICGSLKLSQGVRDGKRMTLIETRGEGGLILCAPTKGYTLVQGSFASLPVLSSEDRDTLLSAARMLNETPPAPIATPSGVEGRPGDDFNARGDVRELLVKHGWTLVKAAENAIWRRPGKDSGGSATLKNGVFYVFTCNAPPLEPNQAYSPFALFTMLEHGGDFSAAARDLRTRGYGDPMAPNAPSEVLPIVIAADEPAPVASDRSSDDATAATDPGPIPESLFHVPGFIDQVIDFALANAPYPNPPLAFCGALALLSFLTGRKVATAGDLRTNLYVLALAASGMGKEFPRKVNNRVLGMTGQGLALGDKFASGEGIQDALVRSPAMLFQTDEMDGVLRQISADRDGFRESIPNILLTLYTSASDLYPIRVKANQEHAVQIDQPHVTIFGTATPQGFYESLSKRLLVNGFFARLFIVDVGKRGQSQPAGSPRDVPEPILDVARWWAELPGDGIMTHLFPRPRRVDFGPGAEEAIADLRAAADVRYNTADAANDEVGRTAWSRTCENATKLALIHACSENHVEPRISVAGVEWARRLAIHQTQRQLFLATTYVAENPFHAECLKLVRMLRAAPGRCLQRHQVLRGMRCKSADLDQIVQTLLQQGDVAQVSIASKTKTATGLQLI